LILIRDAPGTENEMTQILEGFKRGLDDIIKMNYDLNGKIFKNISYQGIVSFH